MADDVAAPRGEVVRITGGPGGTLTFARLAWPGYTARVDGEALPVRQGPAGLLTVDVPAGAHEVELAWSPPAAVPSALAALLGAALAVALAIARAVRRRRSAVRRRRRRPNPRPSSRSPSPRVDRTSTSGSALHRCGADPEGTLGDPGRVQRAVDPRSSDTFLSQNASG